MSTDKKDNQQGRLIRRGPDLRFVWGIVAVVIVCGIFYGGYLKIKDLNVQLTTLKMQIAEKVAKSENDAESHDLSIPGKSAGERKTFVINDVVFAFRWCPAGTYMMGSPKSEEGRVDNETQHEVKLSNGFWMLETEVTVGMFKTFVNDKKYNSQGKNPYGPINGKWNQNEKISWRDPGFSQDDNHPVTCISWNDAVEFCKWLSEKTGQRITLPTEAQWEYACRAGTKEAYAGNLDKMAWYKETYDTGSTHPVGTKTPNAWGLYDMHGNVWEWCLDCKANYPSGSVIDPSGSSNGSYRVMRGGGWSGRAQVCRSACRNWREASDYRGCDLGFRIVRGY